METSMGNALLHVYHPSFALRNEMAYERRRVSGASYTLSKSAIVKMIDAEQIDAG
jgi:hypothetical protein